MRAVYLAAVYRLARRLGKMEVMFTQCLLDVVPEEVGYWYWFQEFG